MRSTCLVASIVLAVALQSLGNMPLYAQDNAKDKTSPVKVTELYKTTLADVPGKEARILQIEIAPDAHGRMALSAGRCVRVRTRRLDGVGTPGENTGYDEPARHRMSAASGRA